MLIRAYQQHDEEGWLRCRVLSFLQTAYFDNVLQKKEVYDNPSIELVAVKNGIVIGLIDIEYELEQKTVCTALNQTGGMIWHIAVHPDFQKSGIGAALLKEAVKRVEECGVSYLEAWTRDDEWVKRWYLKMGFIEGAGYYHLYFEDETIDSVVTVNNDRFSPEMLFAHYTGENIKQFNHLKRHHRCTSYIKKLT